MNARRSDTAAHAGEQPPVHVCLLKTSQRRRLPIRPAAHWRRVAGVDGARDSVRAADVAREGGEGSSVAAHHGRDVAETLHHAIEKDSVIGVVIFQLDRVQSQSR